MPNSQLVMWIFPGASLINVQKEGQFTPTIEIIYDAVISKQPQWLETRVLDVKSIAVCKMNILPHVIQHSFV